MLSPRCNIWYVNGSSGGIVPTVNCSAVKSIQVIERFANCSQHTEAEHVDLEQTQCFEIVFVPLNDRAVFHRRIFDRHELRQRPA